MPELSDAQLIELVQRKTPDELSLGEIERLRERLGTSPELQRILLEQLQLESYLNSALGEFNISVAEIVRRAEAARRERGPWAGWPLWTGLATLLVLVGVAFALNRGGRDHQPDDRRVVADRDAEDAAPSDDDKQLAANNRVPEPLPVLEPEPPAGANGEKPPTNGDTNTDPNPAPDPPAVKIGPWSAALAADAPRHPFAETCHLLPAWERGESLPKETLAEWVEQVPGLPFALADQPIDGIQCARFDGVGRLRAPWPEDAVLRLGLYDPDGLRLHFWSGGEGVTLRYFHHTGPKMWAVYRSTREAGRPTPRELVFIGSDDARHVRSRFGPIEIRWQDGELIVTRGCVRLMTAPLPTSPQEVVFEGKTGLSEIAMFRGGPVPAIDAPARPPVGPSSRPADWPWIADRSLDRRDTLHELAQGRSVWREHLREGVAVESGPRGGIVLQAEKAEELAWAAARLPRAGLYEIIVRLDTAEPGTGVFLGDEAGRPLYRVAFLKDRRTERPVFRPQRPDQADTETDIDPNSAWASYAAPGQWLRIVAGFNSIKLFTSPDGVHWSRAAVDTFRGSTTRPRTVGLFVHKSDEPHSVRLGHLEVRELTGITSLAGDLRERVPAPGENVTQDLSAWHAWTIATRPVDIDLADWRRACAVRTLESTAWGPVSPALLRGLIEEGLTSRRPIEARLRLLDDVALLYDLWGGGDAAAFVAMYERLGEILAGEGHPDPFGVIVPALAAAPIWTEAAWHLPGPRFTQTMLVHEIFGNDWRTAWETSRRARFWTTAAKPTKDHPWETRDEQLLDWAETVAAREVPELADRLSEVHRPLRQHRAWQPPLMTQLSKEGYNVMAEFEAALRAEAWEDACRIVTTAGRGGMLGLLPDSKDAFLLVSLPRAIELAMRDHPELLATMRETFGASARLRVREAVARGDASAVETATVRYYGTEAAAEAHRWLGDRALAAGRFEQAITAYRDGTASADGALRRELETRLRLAAGLMGDEVGELAEAPVEFGEATLPPTEFEALVTELRSARQTEGATITARHQVRRPAPAPMNYTAQVRSRVDGDLGEGAGKFGYGETDAIGRQLAVAADAERFYVSNRFQVTAFRRSDGQVQWRRGLAGESGRVSDWAFTPMRPLVAGDRIFVRRLTKRGIELACLAAADGQVRWVVRPDGHIVSDPVLTAGKLLAVVATTPQSGLVQLDLTSFQPDSGNIVSQQSLLQMRDEWGGRPPCELVAAAGRLVCTAGGATICCDTLGRPQWLHRQTWLPPDVVAPDVRIDDEPPLVERGRVITVPPGVRAVSCLDLATGREQWSRPVPDLIRLVGSAGGRVIVQTVAGFAAFDRNTGEPAWRHDATGVLHGVLCGGQGGLLYSRALDVSKEQSPGLVWLDPRMGMETARCTFDALRRAEVHFGPLLPDGQRIWAFVGTGKDAVREVVELAPQGEPAGPLSPHEFPRWLDDVQTASFDRCARVLPGWTLLTSQRLLEPNGGAPLHSEFRGEKEVLQTRSGKGKPPVRFARRLDLADGASARLGIRVGHAAGQAWTLTLAADGEELLTLDVNDQTAPAGWLDRQIDLSPLAGRTVWLTATQSAADDDEDSHDAYWKRLQVTVAE